jgi:hypothetical protein
MEATQVTLLLLVVGHWYSVVILVGRGLFVIGCQSLVRFTIGCNSISMQFYERTKTAINLYSFPLLCLATHKTLSDKSVAIPNYVISLELIKQQ